ncbi:MAG: hypothetical protein A3G76_09190 [Acidobacteria bacterium RIFCSPLOWO2_12_FULL_65_11]|nr:MAG: hypothetical protein A3H95_01535 [Acidobacteria bacterium RIFCSPLOWO2_02_FULL_64_15]OFW32185.1 MAG: hypothetical protein A3G76_09190 [Acidobacteria bacterium RIFCSPLOWO2_12_FULL_65_11]
MLGARPDEAERLHTAGVVIACVGNRLVAIEVFRALDDDAKAEDVPKETALGVRSSAFSIRGIARNTGS